MLVIHCDDDRFVPYEMSCNIRKAAPEKIEFHTIPGAGHALNYMTAPEEYHRIVHEFTGRCLRNEILWEGTALWEVLFLRKPQNSLEEMIFEI